MTEAGDQRIPHCTGAGLCGGVLGEVRADAEAADADQFDYAHQPKYPEAPDLPATAYRFYLDVGTQCHLAGG